MEIAVKAPACLSWLRGHLSVCHRSWAGRSLRFLGLTSWFESGSAALLPSKEREHGPGDFWEVARLRSESHIPEAWGPASVARDAVPCCQPALAPLGRPHGLLFLLPPPARSCQYKQDREPTLAPALPLVTFVCAGRGRAYALRRTLYPLGLISLDFFFFFAEVPCRGPAHLPSKHTVTLFDWDHRLCIPCCNGGQVTFHSSEDASMGI